MFDEAVQIIERTSFPPTWYREDPRRAENGITAGVEYCL